MDAGGPARRASKARAIAEAGITADDIRVLATHLELNADDPARLPRFLGAFVSDAHRLRIAVDDVRYMIGERSRRAAVVEARKRYPEHMHGMPRGHWNCYCEGCMVAKSNMRIVE